MSTREFSLCVCHVVVYMRVYVYMCVLMYGCVYCFFFTSLLLYSFFLKKLNFNIHLHFKSISCLDGFFFSRVFFQHFCDCVCATDCLRVFIS